VVYDDCVGGLIGCCVEKCVWGLGISVGALLVLAALLSVMGPHCWTGSMIIVVTGEGGWIDDFVVFFRVIILLRTGALLYVSLSYIVISCPALLSDLSTIIVISE